MPAPRPVHRERGRDRGWWLLTPGVMALRVAAHLRLRRALDELAILVAATGRERRGRAGQKAQRGQSEHDVSHDFLPRRWERRTIGARGVTANVREITNGVL